MIIWRGLLIQARLLKEAGIQGSGGCVARTRYFAALLLVATLVVSFGTATIGFVLTTQHAVVRASRPIIEEAAKVALHRRTSCCLQFRIAKSLQRRQQIK